MLIIINLLLLIMALFQAGSDRYRDAGFLPLPPSSSSMLSFLTSTIPSELSETPRTARQVISTSVTVVSSPPVVVAHGVAVLTVAVPVGVTTGLLLLVAAVSGIVFVW